MPARLDLGGYGAWFETALGRRVWADEERVLLELLDQVAGRRVLDAGCSDGRLATSVAGAGATVIGVDLDAGMLRAARERRPVAGGRLHLVRADLQRLPFADGVTDAAVAVTTLCLVTDPAAAVRELARVLRPGGRLVVGELGRWSTWALGRRARALVRGGPWARVRFWTRPGLVRLLRDAGLSPLAFRGAVFYPRSRWLARLVGPLDRILGRRTTIGAAFIGMAAWKPVLGAKC